MSKKVITYSLSDQIVKYIRDLIDAGYQKSINSFIKDAIDDQLDPQLDFDPSYKNKWFRQDAQEVKVVGQFKLDAEKAAIMHTICDKHFRSKFDFIRYCVLRHLKHVSFTSVTRVDEDAMPKVARIS